MQEEKCRSQQMADTEWLAAKDSVAVPADVENSEAQQALTSACAPPDIGTLLDGRYRLVKKLGCGGTSSVFLAEHLSVGNLWAVKILPVTEEPAESPFKETDILKRLSHPMLPRITDVLTHGTNVCIIMDFVRGRNLAERLREDGPIPEPEVRAWLLQLCDVLTYLHNQMPDAVIYRDLKPSNLIADDHGHLKLVDFGTARRYRNGDNLDTAYIGTQGYAAPEQYGFRQSDARTDIYNLGMTLFHLLTGIHPVSVPHGDVEKTLENMHVSQRMNRVICRCVQLSPANRYQDASSLRKELLALEPEPDQGGQHEDPESSGVTGNVQDSFADKASGSGKGTFSYGLRGTSGSKMSSRHRECASQSKHPITSSLFPLGRKRAAPVPAQAHIAVLGACPGAGATFASIAMASYLSGKNRNTALAELNPSGDLLRFRIQLERIGHQVVPVAGQASGEAFRFGQIAYHPSCQRLTDLRGNRMDVVLMDLGSVRTETVIDEFLRADWQFVYCPQADWKFGHVLEFMEAVDGLEDVNRFHYLLPYADRQGIDGVRTCFGKRSTVMFPHIANPFDPSPGESRQLERMFRSVGLEG